MYETLNDHICTGIFLIICSKIKDYIQSVKLNQTVAISVSSETIFNNQWEILPRPLALVSTTLVGQDLLCDVPRSHSLDTPHPVGLLWTSDQPDPDTST